MRVSISHECSLVVAPQPRYRYARTEPARSGGTSAEASPRAARVVGHVARIRGERTFEDLATSIFRTVAATSPSRSPSSIWKLTESRSAGPANVRRDVVKAEEWHIGEVLHQSWHAVGSNYRRNGHKEQPSRFFTSLPDASTELQRFRT